MLAVRPTIMTVVPRVLEVIRARILGQMARQPAWRRALFGQALAAGRRRLEGRANPLDRALDPLLDRLVRAKIRARFGGRFRAAMSGGARLEPEVGQFFRALGIEILQGYGQTEAGPVISGNPPEAIRIETVGRPLAGVDLRIAEDGEILVRGDLVMDGYWRQPEATAAVLRDGWLHTGDIGTLDSRGLSAHHRPQARHHRALGRRERLARARRGDADGRARDRAGGRHRRGCGGPDRADRARRRGRRGARSPPRSAAPMRGSP